MLLSVDPDRLMADADGLIRDLATTLGWSEGRARGLVAVFVTEPSLDLFDDVGSPPEDPWPLDRIVEELQEWVQESRTDTAWPKCPIHPNHPLLIVEHEQPLRWACPAGEFSVPLGKLDASRDR